MRQILFVVLMMVSSVSWAEWEFTASFNHKNYGVINFYHDKSTIRKNNFITKMWTLNDYSIVQSVYSLEYKSEKILYVYNCGNDTVATASTALYSESLGKGAAIWTKTWKETDYEWNSIIPKSVGEYEWKVACGKL